MEETIVIFIKFARSVFIFRHSDIAHILAGDSDRKDIWGMEEIQFVPYVCQRSVKTFMQGPTAYIANINGPVRAIR